MEREIIKEVLKNAAKLIALVPTESLASYLSECERSVEHAEAFGPIFDPTAYMRSEYDGSMQDAKLQNRIGRELYHARLAIDARESHAQKFRK